MRKTIEEKVEYLPQLSVDSKPKEDLAGKRCVLFSYGSGLASSMYSLHITEDLSPDSPIHLLLQNLSDVKLRLERRQKVPPQGFDDIMKLRETTHHKGRLYHTSSAFSLAGDKRLICLLLFSGICFHIFVYTCRDLLGIVNKELQSYRVFSDAVRWYFSM